MGGGGGRGQDGELAGAVAGAAQQGKRRRESAGDAVRAHDGGANAMARQRTRQSGSAGTGTRARQHDGQAHDGGLEGVAASHVGGQVEGEQQRHGSARVARRHVYSGDAARRDGGARDEHDGDLEVVAASAATAAAQPGASSGESARDEQRDERDSDARRAAWRREDDAAAMTTAAAAERGEEQRSNRQQRRPASEPRDELASSLETQGASQDSAGETDAAAGMFGVSRSVGGVGGTHVIIDLTEDDTAPAGATTTVRGGGAPTLTVDLTGDDPGPAGAAGPVGGAAAPARPGGTSAPERTAITHAITLKGSTLNAQILACEKPVENRHFTIPAGWVALHNNADKSDMPAAIVGVARFTHSVPVELVPAGVEGRLRQHCVGPRCNVIAEVQRLAAPIQHVKGALSVWRLTEEHRAELQRRLRADDTTTLTGFDHIFRCPTEAQLRELKRRRQDGEAPAYSRGVKKKRKAKEGEG